MADNVALDEKTGRKYFLDVATLFMLFMHGLQILLLKNTLTEQDKPLTLAQQSRIFIFGVFELFAWQKQQQAAPNKK